MSDMIYIFRVLCTIITVAIFVRTFGRDKMSKEQSLLQMGIAVICIYDLGVVLQTNVTSLEMMTALRKVLGITSCILMLILLEFSIEFSKVKVPKLLPKLAVTVALSIIAAMVLLINRDDLFFKSMVPAEDGTFRIISTEYGMLAIMYEIVVVFLALTVTGVAVMYMRQRSENRQQWLRKRTFLIAAAIPTATLLMSYIAAFIYYDLNMAGLLAATIIFNYASHKYGVFDVVESVKDVMLDHVAEGIVICDYKGRILYKNNIAEKIVDDIGQYTELDIKENTSAGKESEDADNMLFIRSISKEDREYEMFRQSIIHNKEFQGYAYMIQDVTEKKALMENMRKRQEDAEKANETKSEFLASVGHEIRTPLSGIIGMTDVVLHRELDSKTAEDLKSIRYSARILLSFANDLLDMTKIESGHMQLLEQNYRIEEVVYYAMNVAQVSLGEKRIELSANIGKEVQAVLCGDYIRLQQILINLLGNAVKYTEEGSITLDVWCDSQQDDSDEVILGFRVTDTGCGIAKEDLEKIFSKYEQLESIGHRRTSGVGLGLNIVSKMVEMMDGSISVESEQGKGSVFTIQIKQRNGVDSDVNERVSQIHLNSQMLREDGSTSKAAQLHEFTYEGAKILAVDDIETNLMVLRGLLEPYKVNLKCISSPDAAIEELKHTRYDLIFMDNMMPGKSGGDVLKIIRQYESGKEYATPVVVMTADLTGDVRERFINKGFSDYMFKPISLQRLEAILLQWVGSFKRPAAKRETGTYPDMQELRSHGINTDKGLVYTGGSRSVYENVLRSYSEEMHTFYEELERGEDRKEDLQIRIHGLKSSSYAIGATELGKLAEETENRMKANEPYELDLIKQNLVQVLDGINEYFNGGAVEAGKRGSGGTEQITAEQEQLEDWKERLVEAVNGYDAVKAEQILSRMTGRVSKQDQELLNQLKKRISSLDYVACRELLEKKTYS